MLNKNEGRKMRRRDEEERLPGCEGGKVLMSFKIDETRNNFDVSPLRRDQEGPATNEERIFETLRQRFSP